MFCSLVIANPIDENFGTDRGYASLSPDPRDLLRLTILCVPVSIICKYFFDDFRLEFTVGALCDLRQIEILNRISVAIEFERAPQRLKICFLKRRAHGVFV